LVAYAGDLSTVVDDNGLVSSLPLILFDRLGKLLVHCDVVLKNLVKIHIIEIASVERIKLPSELMMTKLKDFKNVCVPTLSTKVG